MGFRQRVSATLLTSGNACELKIHISSKTWIFENEISLRPKAGSESEAAPKVEKPLSGAGEWLFMYTKFEQKNVLEILFSCFIVYSSGPVTIKSLHEQCRFTCRFVFKGTIV